LARLPPGSRVLDAACGIGVDALVLHRQGHRVTAADASPAMIDRARTRFSAAGARIPTMVCRWRQLPDRLPRSYDAVLCTGNALAHLLDDGQVEAALCGFRSVLRDGGVLLLDGHEWDVIPARGPSTERADLVTRDGATATCRYRWGTPSGPPGPHTLEIEISISAADHDASVRTHVVTLRPYTHDQLRRWLREAGFPGARIEVDIDGDRHTAIARAR
jgi:SAM-dependent methyltransferase